MAVAARRYGRGVLCPESDGGGYDLVLSRGKLIPHPVQVGLGGRRAA
jgi:hypothetical protein